jgi:hypothetical protein
MADDEPLNPPSEATARGKQFAKDLLDTLDKPDSAEREAYEALKEREDRESLERFYRITGQRKATPAEAVRDLADAVEKIPPAGPFEPIEIELEMPGVRRTMLRLAASPTKPQKRYVELQVYTPSGISHSSQWMESGTNAELAAFLRRTTTVAEIDALADELAVGLQRNNMA